MGGACQELRAFESNRRRGCGIRQGAGNRSAEAGNPPCPGAHSRARPTPGACDRARQVGRRARPGRGVRDTRRAVDGRGAARRGGRVRAQEPRRRRLALHESLPSGRHRAAEGPLWRRHPELQERHRRQANRSARGGAKSPRRTRGLPGEERFNCRCGTRIQSGARRYSIFAGSARRARDVVSLAGSRCGIT